MSATSRITQTRSTLDFTRRYDTMLEATVNARRRHASARPICSTDRRLSTFPADVETALDVDGFAWLQQQPEIFKIVWEDRGRFSRHLGLGDRRPSHGDAAATPNVDRTLPPRLLGLTRQDSTADSPFVRRHLIELSVAVFRSGVVLAAASDVGRRYPAIGRYVDSTTVRREPVCRSGWLTVDCRQATTHNSRWMQPTC